MVFEREQLTETDLLQAKAHIPERRRSNWFSDLTFHADFSITANATGRRITFSDLTLGEILKFLAYLAVVLVQAGWRGLDGKRGPRLHFAPQRPRPWHVVWSALTLAKMRIVDTPEEADAIFYFEDKTICTPPANWRRRALNGGVTDISKTKVATIFEAVAGYPLRIDPRTHQGLAVEKSETNGAHDGRLVQCPCDPTPGKCYQQFIDSGDGANACDYRTTIIGRRPRFVVVKKRPVDERFSIHNASVAFQELNSVFSAAEVRLLTVFAEEMALDWGAIDVLRHRATAKIYVVDVNKTDTGPAVDLSLRDRERLKAAIASGLSELVGMAEKPIWTNEIRG